MVYLSKIVVDFKPSQTCCQFVTATMRIHLKEYQGARKNFISVSCENCTLKMSSEPLAFVVLKYSDMKACKLVFLSIISYTKDRTDF